MARVWHGTANAIYPANRPAPRSVTPGAREFDTGAQSNNRLFTTAT